MAFSFASHALIDSETLSRFIWGVDDATGDLTGAAVLTDQAIANIELGVNAISRQIMRHVSSDIKSAAYQEDWDGAASDELVPTERPITAVSSILFAPGGQFSEAQNLVTVPGAVCFDRYSIKLRGFRMPEGRGVVRVIYTAGYASVPEDVQLAVAMQFQYVYRKFGKTGDGMVGLKTISKAIGGANESQTKDDTLKKSGLIAEVIGMLEGYQRFEAPLSIMFARVS